MNVRTMLRDGGQTPCYGSLYSAGSDLVSNARCEWTPIMSESLDIVCPVDVDGNIKPTSVMKKVIVGWKCIVSTGVYFELPRGYEMQIRPRSGSAFKHNMTIINTPGTIDADYRGEVKVALMVTGALAPDLFEIDYTTVDGKSISKRYLPSGMKIAQCVLASVTPAVFVVAEQLSSTARGDRGFGSTGVKVTGRGKSTLDTTASISVEFNVGDIHLMGVTAGTIARLIKSLEEYNKDFTGFDCVYEEGVDDSKAMFVTYDVYEFDYNKVDLLDRIKNAIDLVGGRDVVERAYNELPEKKKSY